MSESPVLHGLNGLHRKEAAARGEDHWSGSLCAGRPRKAMGFRGRARGSRHGFDKAQRFYATNALAQESADFLWVTSRRGGRRRGGANPQGQQGHAVRTDAGGRGHARGWRARCGPPRACRGLAAEGGAGYGFQGTWIRAPYGDSAAAVVAGKGGGGLRDTPRDWPTEERPGVGRDTPGRLRLRSGRGAGSPDGTAGVRVGGGLDHAELLRWAGGVGAEPMEAM